MPGPDVIVGDLPDVEQSGSTGNIVGLGIATTSCNNGDQPFDWFALPQYRSSGYSAKPLSDERRNRNNDRFEQIGQSWLKHAFTGLEDNACGFGCNPAVALLAPILARDVPILTRRV